MSYRAMLFSLLLPALAVVACSDADSGHFPLGPPPMYDLSGTWYVTETRDAYDCGGATVVDSPVYDISQASNTLTITDETDGTGSFSARLEHDRLSWSRQYSGSGGTVEAEFSGITSNANCFNGTVNWVWNDGASSCIGSSTISANTSTPGPSC